MKLSIPEKLKDLRVERHLTLKQLAAETGLSKSALGKNHSNTALYGLHLSDDMIDVLKSGKLNSRLLCEMVTHGNFRRFLVDAEIYIDRIADMRINDMNVMLDMVRLPMKILLPQR